MTHSVLQPTPLIVYVCVSNLFWSVFVRSYYLICMQLLNLFKLLMSKNKYGVKRVNV